MRINQIILQNIFSYYDREVITFDDTSYIIAKNGLGKTSILNAIKLCLGYSSIDIDSIFNNNSPHQEASVSIEFDEFIISKTWQVKTQEESLKVSFKDNDYLEDIEAEEFIKEKIPFFLVDLIFYDGELNSNVLLLSPTKLKNLFEYIFDLDILKNISKDTIKASKELMANDENQTLSTRYEELKTTITINDEKLIESKLIKERVEKEIKALQQEIGKLETKQRKQDKKIDTLKSQLEDYQKVFEINLQEFKKAILFEMPLLLNSDLREKILNQQKPIMEIKNKNEFDARLSKLSHKLSIDEESEFKQQFYDMFLNQSFDFELSFDKDSFLKLLNETKELQHNINQTLQEIKEVEDNNLSSDKYNEIVQELNDKRNKIDQLHSQLVEIDSEIESITTENKALEKELTTIYKDQRDGYALIKSQEQLINISKVAEQMYQKDLEVNLQEFNSVLQEITQAFKEQYKHIKTISLTPELGFEIVDEQDHPLSIELLSAGQKQVLNFLIITTILRFSQFSNFLIVDTPFGRLSKDNRELILKSCYLSFDQLALLLTDSEFEFMEAQKLKHKKYHITKEKLGSKIVSES
ncbi:MAG: AAA family ATPase [Campylobacterota bacterium]|nr:AAA family ATPase [Campylobacterota bacterium]